MKRLLGLVILACLTGCHAWNCADLTERCYERSLKASDSEWAYRYCMRTLGPSMTVKPETCPGYR